MQCGCHCIKCGSTKISSKQIGRMESDGYFDVHHTCKRCNTHFDHLESSVFESYNICKYETTN